MLIRGGRGDGIFLILESFFQTIDTFEKGLEDICFGAALFGNCIWRRTWEVSQVGRSCEGEESGIGPSPGNRSILGLRSCALTINAWALEDLTGLATGTETVAFDLEKKR